MRHTRLGVNAVVEVSLTALLTVAEDVTGFDPNMPGDGRHLNPLNDG